MRTVAAAMREIAAAISGLCYGGSCVGARAAEGLLEGSIRASAPAD